MVKKIIVTSFIGLALAAGVAFGQFSYPAVVTMATGGTVTDITAAAPLTGGTINMSGTIGCTTCAVLTNTTTATSATLTPNVIPNGGSLFTVTALAVPATFAPPSGSSNQGDTLLIRIKGDTTPRALTFNAIYRASTDLPLPTTTTVVGGVAKTMYLSFMRNTNDNTWDFMAKLDNF